ncbi:hypothetical protein D9M72_362100 [compost metagenome]
MENTSEFDSASSAAAGVYRQNAFYYRMDSMFDLDPDEGDPLPSAVPFHAHEYVHFLHNASTTAGNAYLVSNLILLRALAAGTNEFGHFLGPGTLKPDQLAFLNFVGGVIHGQLGATSSKKLGSNTDIQAWECSAAQIETTELGTSVHSTFVADDGTGAKKFERIAIGLSFVTEGVAYEIDREMRRLGGVSVDRLDEGTRVFPYLAYRLLVRNWSKRDLAARDYIAIGISALHSNAAGYGLAEICRRLKETTVPVDEVLDLARSQWDKVRSNVLDQMRQQQIDLDPGDVIWSAMGEYMALVEAGARLRRNRWAPELEFLSEIMTVDGFKKAVGTMLDCLVIQGKPDNAHDMYWRGPNVVARTEKKKQRLGALQSALHFSQLHISADGAIHATEALPSTKCPFAGGCGVELWERFPQECRSRPWMRVLATSTKEKGCWYVTGVKALQYASRS